MITKELSEEYDSLPETVKSAILALSILIGRVKLLSPADSDDLFELFQQWRKAESQEECVSIRLAMEEILAQRPIGAKPMFSSDEKGMPRGLKQWAEHVGRKIRELRSRIGLTQEQLAAKASLPQSHISRLENAEHSATHMTLKKIAAALGVEVGEIDPCVE